MKKYDYLRQHDFSMTAVWLGYDSYMTAIRQTCLYGSQMSVWVQSKWNSSQALADNRSRVAKNTMSIEYNGTECKHR